MSENISLPTERFDKFPEHYQVLKNAISFLSSDPKVKGIYLTGSFAGGNPDEHSDLDINILVNDQDRETMVKEQQGKREQVAQVATWFPAVHLHKPNQIIVFYEGNSPIHVDYDYKISSELQPKPKGKEAIIVLDKSGELEKWKKACENAKEEVAPTAEKLQYFEDRFWGWCIYTHGKINRGELFEARDAIEYMRSDVLVRLAYYQLGLSNEGNRRLEKKFPPVILDSLLKTIPQNHNKDSYATALNNMVDSYLKLFQGAISTNKIDGIKEVDRNYFLATLKK